MSAARAGVTTGARTASCWRAAGAGSTAACSRSGRGRTYIMTNTAAAIANTTASTRRIEDDRGGIGGSGAGGRLETVATAAQILGRRTSVVGMCEYRDTGAGAEDHGAGGPVPAQLLRRAERTPGHRHLRRPS